MKEKKKRKLQKRKKNEITRRELQKLNKITLKLKYIETKQKKNNKKTP